jgi:hypothetical protein
MPSHLGWNAFSLSAAHPGISTILGAKPADKMAPCRAALFTAATFEKSAASGCEEGQAIGGELKTNCVELSLVLLTCAFFVSRL